MTRIDIHLFYFCSRNQEKIIIWKVKVKNKEEKKWTF